MTEREALVTAIVANPEDILARLVFADFLDETQESGYAEFIRAQCELENLVHCDKADCQCENCVKIRHFRRVELMWTAGSRGTLRKELEIDTGIWRPGTVPTIEDGTPTGLFRRGFIEAIYATRRWMIGDDCVHCDGTGDYLAEDGPGEIWTPETCRWCKGDRFNYKNLVRLMRVQPILYIGITDAVIPEGMREIGPLISHVTLETARKKL